jgi:hypothetical protein
VPLQSSLRVQVLELTEADMQELSTKAAVQSGATSLTDLGQAPHHVLHGGAGHMDLPQPLRSRVCSSGRYQARDLPVGNRTASTSTLKKVEGGGSWGRQPLHNRFHFPCRHGHTLHPGTGHTLHPASGARKRTKTPTTFLSR